MQNAQNTKQALRTIARTTDEALAPLLQELAITQHRIESASKARRVNEGWIAELREKKLALQAEAAPLRKIEEAGRWTRFVYVPGGHVHRWTGCSTLRWDTTQMWLPEYSGADEEELVEAAADAACTVCFPTAPVNKPTTIPQLAAEREAREAERTEREAKRTAAAAAAIVNEDGEAVFKSQRAAENELGQVIGTAAYYAAWYPEVGSPAHGIPMKPNDESEAEHAARQAPKVAAELAKARRIVELLQLNGVPTEELVAKKLKAKMKENTKHGAILPTGFGL
ncbi:hypothetical protein ACMX2H_18290 [Arthrobacter sulfonylureivorans]|uniref:hypothetical protein n=1 Tax=Arthrobacter sulfonylureivorans TaxID=2486855 RepID=UPI0039E7255F